MIRGLWFFARLALVVVVAVWLAERPGAASIEWQGWLVETSAAMLIGTVFVIVVVALLLARLLRIVQFAPTIYARSRRRQAKERAGRDLTRGLVAIAAGDTRDARRLAQRAVEGPGVSDPALAHFLAGQAAHAAGELAQAEEHFRILRDQPETRFLGLRGLIALALERGDDEQALTLAREARRVNASSLWAAKTLFELEARAHAWAQAEHTLADAERLNAFAPLVARRHHVAVLLARAEEAARNGATADAIAHAQKAHELDPASAPAAVRLATLLDAAGRAKPAARALERSWVERPHASIAAAWASLDGAATPLARAQRLERLIELTPDSPVARQALGEAQAEAGLWGDARANLTKAAEAGGLTRRLGRALARVEEGAGADPSVVRSWLVRALEAGEDPAWVCGTCGTETESWSAACPNCHAFDSMVWGPRPPTPPAPLSVDPVGDALLLRAG
jgi:HemY protein